MPELDTNTSRKFNMFDSWAFAARRIRSQYIRQRRNAAKKRKPNKPYLKGFKRRYIGKG